MNIVKTILQALLIAQFGFFGSSKVLGTPDMVESFTAFGFPAWAMVLVGLVELTAVVCFAYGFINKQAVYVGAALIAVLTVGAVFCHLVLEGNAGNAIPPIVVFLQNALMIWLHNRVAGARPSVALV